MAAKEGACEAGESVVVSPSLLTAPVDGWDLPGFSLGVDHWFAAENEPPKKKKCLSLSRQRSSPLQDSTNRFTKPVEATVLEEAAKGVVPLKTEQSTRWAVANFNSWALSRSSSSADAVPSDILKSHDAELICRWICAFMFETRKTDGSRYPPATLRSLVSGLNRELQRNGAPFSVLDKSDGRFRALLKTLDTLSCELHREGIGAGKKSAKVVDSEHEMLFLEKNLLGVSTPKLLQRTVFFYVGFNFVLRGVQEQYDLVPNQFHRVPEDRMVYDSFLNPNLV